MPVHRYGYQSRHQQDPLVLVLAAELRAEGDSSPVPILGDAPEIFIETIGASYRDAETAASNRLRVCVIWSRWQDVPEVQRPAVILDAFEQAGRKEERDRIAVAMGLTPGEAETLGIDPQKPA